MTRRLPESSITPDHILDLWARVRLRHSWVSSARSGSRVSRPRCITMAVRLSRAIRPSSSAFCAPTTAAKSGLSREHERLSLPGAQVEGREPFQRARHSRDTLTKARRRFGLVVDAVGEHPSLSFHSWPPVFTPCRRSNESRGAGHGRQPHFAKTFPHRPPNAKDRPTWTLHSRFTQHPRSRPILR
jgi:hypothetical protein